MEDTLLVWGLGLLAASLLLIIIEVLVPSAGLIALTAAGTAIAGIVCLFQYDPFWGVMGILAMIVLGPLSFAFALRVLPSTPFGRKMLGEKPPEVVERERLDALRERETRMALVGAEGVVKTDLRPVGTVEIDGTRYPAISEGPLIRAGSRVRVVAADMNQVKVRQANT